MKTTDQFKNTIKGYLDNRAQNDELFAVVYAKENKNIDDCITYILNSVKASGCNGFTDEEVFGMAVHYYDEDNIDIGRPVRCDVVINHEVELTEEDKQEAKRAAMYQVIQMEKQRLSGNKPAKKKEETKAVEEPSLF